MSDKKSKDLESEILEDVQAMLKKEFSILEEPMQIEEAYVASPKAYPQATDFVTNKTKTRHEELYKKYIEALNKVSAEIDGVSLEMPDANSNSDKLRSLKKDEQYLLNAVYLHELYFANCFSPNSSLYRDMVVFSRVESDWGDFEKWSTEFRYLSKTARNGWVVLGYSLFLKRYLNIIIDGHDGGIPMGFVPLLVVDMWEHSYISDYGTDKDSYINAMLREVNWEVVEERCTKVDELKKVMK